MAFELVLLGKALELIGTERVVKFAKDVWSKSKWARDPTKVNAVERKIDTLTHEAGRLARGLAPDAVKPEVDRLVERFERDLVELGLTREEAIDLRLSLALQLETSVLEPIAEARRLQSRIEALERENAEGARRLGALEPLAARTLEAERRASAAVTMAGVALGLAGLATIATLVLAIVRR